MAELPKCRNRHCPNYNSNQSVRLVKENGTEWSFYCFTCEGLEVRSKPDGKKRAQMEQGYRAKGRPEYARTKAHFDLGRH